MGGHQGYDVAIVGGGIVGLAVARALLLRRRRSVVVLEAEPRLAAHQTGRNSGVIHSGLYYRPGSLKARLCTEGRQELVRFCVEHAIPHEVCGKLVVAVGPEDLAQLSELARRGAANGLMGIEPLDLPGMRRIEPEVAGVAGLRVFETGIVDYPAVAQAIADEIASLGGEVRLSARVVAVGSRPGAFALSVGRETVIARGLINCAGLHSDRIARLAGVDPGVRIVPFRGEYWRLSAASERLVRHLIYPVPDPRFPFLGVHLTRMVRGGVEAGPNAVLSLSRGGYGRLAFAPRDAWSALSWPGFWRLARRNLVSGVAEIQRSLSKRRFAQDLARLVPAIGAGDLVPGGAGLRAQAVTRDGALVDDFHFIDAPRMLHVLNAPSPAATASLAIGRVVAERADRLIGAD